MVMMLLTRGKDARRPIATFAPIGTAATVAFLFAVTDAHAIVGDRGEAFGLDGSFRTVTLATQNYDAPALFGPEDHADGMAQGILRLVAGGHFSDWLSYEAHLVQTLTLEAFGGPGGSRGSTALLGTGGGPLPYRFVPLQTAFGEKRASDVHAQLFVDRLSFKLSFSQADVTLGRQALTFGKAYFWNPLDVFLAFGSTQFDRDYKAGVDGARIDIPLGDFSGVTLVGVIGNHKTDDLYFDSAMVARAYGTVGEWDLALQGGKIRGGYQIGAATTGEVFTIELRAEAAYFLAMKEEPLDDNLTAVVGVGRRFESTLYFQAEHLFNGGSTSSLLGSLSLMGAGRLQQASRNVTGITVSYEILPVLIGSVTTLIEWDNLSMLLQPGLSYSAADEVDLMAGAIIAVGSRPEAGFLPIPTSEFGTYSNVFYAEAKAYF